MDILWAFLVGAAWGVFVAPVVRDVLGVSDGAEDR